MTILTSVKYRNTHGDCLFRLNGNSPLIWHFLAEVKALAHEVSKIVIIGQKFVVVPRGAVKNLRVSPLQLRTDRHTDRHTDTHRHTHRQTQTLLDRALDIV